jgi:hypothetical protein
MDYINWYHIVYIFCYIMVYHIRSNICNQTTVGRNSWLLLRCY